MFIWALNFSEKLAIKNKEITKRIEKKYNIPEGLLYAIMQVESQGNALCVYSNKKGKRKSVCFKNLVEAQQYVMVLQRLGIKNINVGCMQINLSCHKNDDLALWFVAEYNVDYAGRFLMNLKRWKGSWKEAVAFYHSGSKSNFHDVYLHKVNRLMPCKNLWNI